MDGEKTDETPAAPSKAAQKLAATIVKRANETVRNDLGVNAVFKPIGLETLIDLYFESERKKAWREGWNAGACVASRAASAPYEGVAGCLKTEN